MPWRDNLVTASFRGVEFQTDEVDGMAAGRRGPEHEYPGRDTPFSEDLGAVTKRFTVEAFIIGDDFLDRGQQLIDACDMPGPGEFVHPYRGARQVVCRGCEESVRLREGRMARYTLTFVDAGANRNPTDRADTAAVTESRAATARLAIRDVFSPLFGL